MKKLLLFVCCLALVSFVNCSEDKYKLKVVLNSNSGDGCTAYAILVSEGGDPAVDPAEYRGSAVINGTTATISIDDIEEDTYEGGVFIDINGSSTGSDDPRPNAGDRVVSETVDMDDDKTMTILDSEWTDL